MNVRVVFALVNWGVMSGNVTDIDIPLIKSIINS